MDNIHFSQDMIKSDSLFLSELWKQTNTISWSASTTKKLSPAGLDIPIPVHNDIKEITIEKSGEIVSTLFKLSPEALANLSPEPKDIKDWIWDQLVIGKFASLSVLRLLQDKKRKDPYDFSQDIRRLNEFLTFCSIKEGVLMHQLGDNHLSENLFTEYLCQGDVSIRSHKLLAALYSRCFPGQKLTVTVNHRKKMKLISHPLNKKYLEVLTDDGVSDYTLYFCKYSCSKFLHWLHHNVAIFHSYQPENIPIHLIKISELTAFRQYLMKQCQGGYLGEHKASDILYYVRAWFDVLYQLEMITQNISTEVTGIFFERYHERELPTDIELQHFFAVIRSYSPKPNIHTTAFSLMLYLGLRNHEVGNLQWKDINLSTKTIIVHGKGDRFDILPLPSVLVNLLTELKKVNQLSEYIFDPSPQRFMQELYRWYKLYALVTSWRFPGGVHLFRHCFITALSKLNCPPQLLMYLARHKRPETTTLYIHRNNELPDAVNKINYF